MHVLVAVLASMGAALLVLVLSSLVASVAAPLREREAALVMESSMAAFTLLATSLMGGPAILGEPSLPPRALAWSTGVAGLLAAAVYMVDRWVLGGCEPPIQLGGVLWRAVLLLVAAPAAEELLFRGLVEGYLLAEGAGLAVAVAVPALLFSLSHLQPYRGSGRGCLLLVLAFSLALGVVAGLARAETGSIVVPIIVHVVGNLPGLAAGGGASR